MNRLISILLLLTSCSGEQTSYPWFEGEWISDSDSSVSINPEYEELNAEDLQIIRDMYGKIRWSIRENTIKFIDDRGDQNIEFEDSFTISPIDAERFQMVTAAEKRDVWKSDSGFCTVLSLDYLSEVGTKDNNVGLECFEPYGT